MAVNSNKTTEVRSRPRARRHPLGKQFLRLWSGFALASSGDGFAYGAVPLLAVVVDPRPLAVSAVVAADGLPWLLVALPAGAFADRFERGRVMALSNLCRALVVAVVAMLLVSHEMDLPILLCAVLGNATGRATYYSAMQASIPALVETGSLERANGVLTGTEAANEHLGGPIVGSLAFALARALPFVAESAVLALSCVPFIGHKGSEPTVPVKRGSVWDGARLLWRDSRLRLLLSLVSALAGLQGLVAGILVLVATRDWGVRASLYGVFVASGAAGNLPGALVAERLSARLGSVVSLLAAAFVAGGCYLVMAFAHSFWVAGAAFAVAGFAIGVGIVVSNTLRQRLAPPELMGRVGAAWRGIAWGAAPVGSLLAGTFALLGGLRLPILLAGGLQCAVALVLAPFLIRSVGRSLGRQATSSVLGATQA